MVEAKGQNLTIYFKTVSYVFLLHKGVLLNKRFSNKEKEKS